jgi:hypothetical protein
MIASGDWDALQILSDKVARQPQRAALTEHGLIFIAARICISKI